MNKKIRLISFFTTMLLLFQLVYPISNESIAYADSLSGKGINEIENIIEETIIDEDFNEQKEDIEIPLDNNEENTIEDANKENGQADEVNDEINSEMDDVLEDKTYVNENVGDVEIKQETYAISYMPEDVNKNGIVNEEDLDLVSAKYNIISGSQGYDAACDINGDGIIDVYDLTLVSNKLYTTSILKGKVTADVLNVRRGPSTGDGIVGTVYYGNVVEILDDSNDSWYRIKYGNITGYASSQYIYKYTEHIPVKPPTGAKIIAIDPGHGGRDPGAVGPGGTKEKDITLKVGIKVRDLLESYGYTVVMTRTGDYRLDENLNLDLIKRAQVANDNNADLFVSIHANSVDNAPTANGTETFYHVREANGSKAHALALAVQKNIVNSTGLNYRKVETRDFSVLRNTTMPAALTELAFISNPYEEQILGTEDFQNKAARAIVDGIVECLQ